MSNRHRLPYAALGGYLAVFLGVSLALAQDNAPENIPKLAPTIEKGKGVAVDAPSPEGSTKKQPKATSPPPQQAAQPTVTIKSEREAPPACDERCQAANQRKQDDLIAQQSMANAAEHLVWLTLGEIIVGAVAITLLIITLRYTRQATRAAIEAAHAAQGSVHQAQRQADAAILLEAAKIVFLRAYFSPARGGVVTARGIPENWRAGRDRLWYLQASSPLNQ